MFWTDIQAVQDLRSFRFEVRESEGIRKVSQCFNTVHTKIRRGQGFESRKNSFLKDHTKSP